MRDGYRFRGQGALVLTREVLVTRPDRFSGVRTDIYLRTDRGTAVGPHDLEYLAGSAFYRHLDPDRDGVPDTHSTFSMAWCEDKLPVPAVMYWDPRKRRSMALARADLPDRDPDILPNLRRGERFFVADTRMGSVGFAPVAEGAPGMALRAHFPSYEGPQSFSIDRSGSPWGRFVEARPGARFTVSWLLRVAAAESFPAACWDLYTYLLRFYHTTPPALSYSFEEANACRIDVLNRSYREWDEPDGERGAAYVVNCHPEDGITLDEVVEYGFTGPHRSPTRTRTSATRRRRVTRRCARVPARVIDFYVRRVIQPNGFAFGVYRIPQHEFVCWWSGITLPCAFSSSQAELATHLSEEMAADLVAAGRRDARHAGQLHPGNLGGRPVAAGKPRLRALAGR